MVQDHKYYIGIMSGTSMDGIDLALVDFSNDLPKVLATKGYPWPNNLGERLHPLCYSSNDEIEKIGDLSLELAHAYANAVKALLKDTGISADEIIAIGNHGQTIRHRPERHFSIQISNNAALAALTNIDTIGDFRSMDLALGGEGAPLVPAFHKYVFAQKGLLRFIVNIGGIANISVLDGFNDRVFGYDTGPGNTLLDQNCRFFWQDNYDHNGEKAKSGIINKDFLAKLLNHPYLAKPYPKSTGRETFTYSWIKELNETFKLNGQDLQRTLTYFSAKTIADQINKIAGSQKFEVYICGGGLNNTLLMQDLETELKTASFFSSTWDLGVDPDFVEAIAFAWLAKQFVEREPSNLPAVTGASRSAILGCLYPKPF